MDSEDARLAICRIREIGSHVSTLRDESKRLRMALLDFDAPPRRDDPDTKILLCGAFVVYVTAVFKNPPKDRVSGEQPIDCTVTFDEGATV